MKSKKIQQKSFTQELIISFSKKRKIIPSKFHYDLKGSKYFEKITKTKEYYVTRVEKEILNKISNQINEIFGNNDVPSRQEIIENLIPYIKEEIKKGTRLNQIMRHTLGLFHGQTGASYWKRYLSENMCVRDADVQKINHIMDKIKYNNVETRVG